MPGQDFIDLDANVDLASLNKLLGAYARVGPPDPTDVANPTRTRLELIEQSNSEFRAPFFNGGNLDKTASRP